MNRSGMTAGMVSVVICSWNNWPDLEMAIASALHQSYGNLEVIVVDNSSTDATAEEVPRRFGASLRFLRQANRGTAGAHNTGFAASSGEFIQFLSGDDVLAPNKIEKQVEVFRRNAGIDIVYGDVRKFQTSAGRAGWLDATTAADADMLGRLLTPGGSWQCVSTLGALFHRRALEQVGGWDESLYVEDLDYWLRAAWAGCRFEYCSGSPMGFARIRQGQKTANLSEMADGREAVWEKALGYMTSEPHCSRVRAILAHCRYRSAIFRDHGSRRASLKQLSLARQADPEAIPPLVYAAGAAAIILPGGASIVRSQRLHSAREALARLFRYRFQPLSPQSIPIAERTGGKPQLAK